MDDRFLTPSEAAQGDGRAQSAGLAIGDLPLGILTLPALVAFAYPPRVPPCAQPTWVSLLASSWGRTPGQDEAFTDIFGRGNALSFAGILGADSVS